MNKNLTQFLLIVILLTACGPAVLPPSPTIPVTQTIAPSPTPTSRPTQTVIPAATPHPTLQTEGPYLLFTYNNKNFTIMDADGSGQKQFQLPNDGYVDYQIENAVSPDGKWLAYFTGTTKEPYDLTLNLFNMKDETIFPIANLLAPGYPDNLESIPVDGSVTSKDSCADSRECRLSLVQSDFEFGIKSLAWSPDSKSLAFTAQIDGPSSDVYVFDLHQKTTRRLVDDNLIISQIDWSPNGKSILYENTITGSTHNWSYVYVADPLSDLIQSAEPIYDGPFWSSAGWVNENSYLIWEGGEGAPPQNFKIMNTDSLQVKEIWEYTAESFFVDKEKTGIFLLTFPSGLSDTQPEPEEGLYFLTFDGNYKKLTSEIFTPLQVRGPLETFFALQQVSTSLNDLQQIISIEQNGTITPLERKVYYSNPPLTSLDGKWVIMVSDKGTELYSERLKLIKSWDIYSSRIMWRPDSLGMFLFINTGMYYLPVPNGELTLIEDCAPDYCLDMDYVWLP